MELKKKVKITEEKNDLKQFSIHTLQVRFRDEIGADGVTMKEEWRKNEEGTEIGEWGNCARVE